MDRDYCSRESETHTADDVLEIVCTIFLSLIATLYN
jgi:hypothetical protein